MRTKPSQSDSMCHDDGREGTKVGDAVLNLTVGKGRCHQQRRAEERDGGSTIEREGEFEEGKREHAT